MHPVFYVYKLRSFFRDNIDNYLFNEPLSLVASLALNILVVPTITIIWFFTSHNTIRKEAPGLLLYTLSLSSLRIRERSIKLCEYLHHVNVLIEVVDSLIVHAVKYVCVSVECYVYVGVTEPVFQHYGRNARLDASGRESVSECMLAVRRDTDLIAHSLVIAVDLRSSYKRVLAVIIEDQIILVRLLLLQCLLKVWPELAAYRDIPCTGFRLGRVAREFPVFETSGYSPPDMDDTVLEINI